MARNRRGGGLGSGLLLIAVGTIFLLDRTDMISMGQVWRMWPLFIIWIGLMQLVRPESGRRSVFLLLIGIWLQISTLELFGLDFSDSWPLAIIAVGASFVFDSLLKGSSSRPARAATIEVDAVVDADPTGETTDDQ